MKPLARATGGSVSALLTLIPSTGVGETPMSYLESAGAWAAPMTSLIWGLLYLSAAGVIVITLLVIGGKWKRRTTDAWQPGQRSGVEQRRFGVPRWLSAALVATTITLAAFVGWTMSTMAANRSPDQAEQFTIHVIGHQWWWEVRYVGSSPSQSFTTANEIRIPSGRRIRLRLSSADVIHSFWVPALSGKTDLIPGRTNETWLEANRPGEFRGQCAEFCGHQHALMALRVVSLPAQDFADWWAQQLQPAPGADGGSETVRNGRQLFVAKCGICHTVRGTLAGGKLGPDLSHLMSRETLAANTIANTHAGLSAWIAAPQQIKPKNKMPNLELSSEELLAISEFLYTLH